MSLSIWLYIFFLFWFVFSVSSGCCVSCCCLVLGVTLTFGSAYLAVLDLLTQGLKKVFVVFASFISLKFLISNNKFSYVYNVVIWLGWNLSVKIAICLNNFIVFWGFCVTIQVFISDLKPFIATENKICFRIF